MSEITAKTLEEIVKKLVGKITPVGATHIDQEREKNLEVYIGLHEV